MIWKMAGFIGQLVWLDLMTKTIQVQRGLGASKLAIPAVGGTMNILTKGINNKEEVTFFSKMLEIMAF